MTLDNSAVSSGSNKKQSLSEKFAYSIKMVALGQVGKWAVGQVGDTVNWTNDSTRGCILLIMSIAFLVLVVLVVMCYAESTYILY